MAAPAANEAQPQGPQVPRVPQANVVQHILAERPPQKPILDSNGLEVMCLPFFHTSLALLPFFMCTCRHVLICPLLLHFAKYFALALPPFTFIWLFLSSWLTLFITLLSAFRADMYFISVLPAWEVLWIVCLFPHDRCYLLYPLCILLGLFPAREVLFVVTS